MPDARRSVCGEAGQFYRVWLAFETELALRQVDLVRLHIDGLQSKIRHSLRVKARLEEHVNAELLRHMTEITIPETVSKGMAHNVR